MPSVDTPDYTNSWYDSQLPVWTFLADMLGGQDPVKAKTTVYLPQEPAEDDQDYQRRLNRSVFFEDYRDCVINLSGMGFRKPPKLATDVPVEIRGLEEVTDESGAVTQQRKEGLAENIDNAGSHYTSFLQRVFEDGFNGLSYIVVDMPSPPASSRTAQGTRTAQDEQQDGLRSHWRHRKVTEALNWRVREVKGKTILTQITFQECTVEADGAFGEVEVTRWRVYRLNELGDAEWQLWEERESNRDSKGRFASNQKRIEMVASDLIRTKKGKTLKRLPVAVHYGEYEGFLKSRPPLKNIADINLAIYQKYSDVSNLEHFTCAPTLCITGEDDGGDKTLGGNRIIYVPVGGDAKFLEVNGDSIPAMERDLENLQKRMVAKGLDFVQEDHRVPTTATEIKLSYIQRTSKLAKMFQNLKSAAEEALSIMAEMEGLDQGGSISLGVDENALTLTAEQIRMLSEMNERGQISLETLWSLLIRADELPEDFDMNVEIQRLKEAAERQMELNAKQFDAGLESTP